MDEMGESMDRSLLMIRLVASTVSATMCRV